MRTVRFLSGASLLLLCSLQVFPLSSAQESLRGKLENSINGYVTKGFSGSVLVAVNDTIILDEGFGFTDPAKRYRVTPTTLFNIASITKTFTALGILKLEENGLLKLTDSIGKYFKVVPPDKRTITSHELLTHTSGLQQHYVDMEVSRRDTLKFMPGADKTTTANRIVSDNLMQILFARWLRE
jgi:CubicO group peptidase (beta-lactamase class C family)